MWEVKKDKKTGEPYLDFDTEFWVGPAPWDYESFNLTIYLSNFIYVLLDTGKITDEEFNDLDNRGYSTLDVASADEIFSKYIDSLSEEELKRCLSE